jgi:hypothetical protein
LSPTPADYEQICLFLNRLMANCVGRHAVDGRMGCVDSQLALQFPQPVIGGID